MLYNLGEMKIVSEFLLRAGFVVIGAAMMVFLCITLSILVRFGNWILGF